MGTALSSTVRPNRREPITLICSMFSSALVSCSAAFTESEPTSAADALMASNICGTDCCNFNNGFLFMLYFPIPIELF